MKTLLYIVGGLAGLMVLMNWHTCSQHAGYANAYWLIGGKQYPVSDANGNAAPVPAGASVANLVTPASGIPKPSCLFTPFPGGL